MVTWQFFISMPMNGNWLLQVSILIIIKILYFTIIFEGIPDANEPISFKDMPRRSVFSKKFWETWESLKYSLPTDTKK